MKHFKPVHLVVDLDVPECGYFTDDTMDGPLLSSTQVSQIFFGRDSGDWLEVRIERRGGLTLDGEVFVIPRGVDSDFRRWRLCDVERVGHALAQSGYIAVDQLYRILITVRTIAETWGLIPAAPVPTRQADYEPDRKGVYAVSQETERRDDVDGQPGALPRKFSLGDVVYEIDLTDQNWNALIAALAPFTSVARGNQGRTDDPTKRVDRGAVRQWARDHGFGVGLRGKIPQATMTAYLNRKDDQ